MNTEQPNVETPSLEGAGGNQPPVSQTQGNSIAGQPQSSQELLELKKIIEQQGKELRGLQSRQDKEKNETQRFLDEIKAHVANGKTIDEAEQIVNATRKDAEKDQLLYKIAAKLGLDESSPTATGTSANVTDDVTRIFKKFDVDMNDPAAVPLLSLKGADLVEKVAELALSKTKQPTLDSSAATSLGSSPAPKAGVDVLTEKYQKDMLAARGNKSLLKSIRETARKNGVPVDTIVFV